MKRLLLSWRLGLCIGSACRTAPCGTVATRLGVSGGEGTAGEKGGAPYARRLAGGCSPAHRGRWKDQRGAANKRGWFGGGSGGWEHVHATGRAAKRRLGRQGGGWVEPRAGVGDLDAPVADQAVGDFGHLVRNGLRTAAGCAVWFASALLAGYSAREARRLARRRKLQERGLLPARLARRVENHPTSSRQRPPVATLPS